MRRNYPRRYNVKCEIDCESLAKAIPAHQEIDYDKLAASIVKAKSEHDAKKRNSYSGPRESLKFIMHAIWDCVGVLFAAITVYMFLAITKTFSMISSFPPGQGFTRDLVMTGIKGIAEGALLFFSFSMALVSFSMGRDIEKIKDFSVVSSLFSNVTALVAFVVALVALLREVL